MASPVMNKITASVRKAARAVVLYAKENPRKTAALILGLILAGTAAAVMIVFPPAAILAVIPAVIASSPALLGLTAGVAGFVGGLIIAGIGSLVKTVYDKKFGKEGRYNRVNFDSDSDHDETSSDKMKTQLFDRSKRNESTNEMRHEAPTHSNKRGCLRMFDILKSSAPEEAPAAEHQAQL